MEHSKSKAQEGDDKKLIEEIYQIKHVSLGEGAATCQVCGYFLYEGDAVTAYVFRPAGEVGFQVGYVVCGSGEHEFPAEFTLGVRELVVEGRVGRCSDAATQSSWPVLLAPEVVAVSAAASKSVRMVVSDDEGSVDEEVRSDDGSETWSSVKVSRGGARRRADRLSDEVVCGLNGGDLR